MKTKHIRLLISGHWSILWFSLKAARSVPGFLLLALAGSTLLVAPLRADSLLGLYTQVALGDPDFGGGYNAGSPLGHGLVQTQLGPNGLPVLSPDGISRLGTGSDMNPATDELLWWSAGADPFVGLDQIPVQTDSLPLNFGFPLQNWNVTGQTDDQSFYRTVHWEGAFNMASAGQISLYLQTDDDGWLFIDGSLVTEYHYGDPGLTVYTTVSGGTHRVDIFYDDRAPIFNQVVFSSSASISPVPEPDSVALWIVGFAGLLARGLQKRRVTVLGNH